MKITDDMLTEEFAADIKPVHEGVYPVRSAMDESIWLWSCWRNGQWRWVVSDRGQASRQRRPTGMQGRIWKGLKEKHHG